MLVLHFYHYRTEMSVRHQCLEAERTTHAIMPLHALRGEAHMLQKTAHKYNNARFTGHHYTPVRTCPLISLYLQLFVCHLN